MEFETILSICSVLAAAAGALPLIAWRRASRRVPHRLALRPVDRSRPRALQLRERPDR